MHKDYYKILEISEFSSTSEIKSAYRKLARKWHPDVAGNTPDNIKKFKEINEAYETLSDLSKKSSYDKAREFYNYAKGVRGKSEESTVNNSTNPNSKPEKEKTSFSFNWEEFLARKSREKQFKTENNIPKKGKDITSDIEISVFEAISGATKTINMLQTSVCPKCGGRRFVNGSKCSECNAKGEISNYKRFNVKIPAGVKNLSKIRLAGEGEKGLNGGRNGDLYLTIHIIEPKNYKTDGLDILKVIPISPYEAVLGGNISVQTLQGNVLLKLKPNTQNGQKIRLSGCGIVQNKKVGDMIVTVEIRIPQKLSSEEIELYKRLQEISSSSIREMNG